MPRSNLLICSLHIISDHTRDSSVLTAMQLDGLNFGFADCMIDGYFNIIIGRLGILRS